jgi:alpha-D-xyloside xylohydrolase
MGLAGIPWWTTDTGGFHGGVNNDPAFRECLIRWFQFSTFSPVLRMHGDREPHSKPLSTTGGGKCASGAPNELWSYGEEVLPILEKYLRIRERLRPYVRTLMTAAHETHLSPLTNHVSPLTGRVGARPYRCLMSRRCSKNDNRDRMMVLQFVIRVLPRRCG